MIIPNNTSDGHVGLFFVADGKMLLHTCTLSDGETYSDFINYPESHDAVWQREYAHKYGVDFDYYPRGRVVFNRTTGIYTLYQDPCIGDSGIQIRLRICPPPNRCKRELDEHYQCHMCNADYVI